MLASDVVWNARAARTLNGDQVAALERLVFSGGKPEREQIEILDLIDSYLVHRCEAWSSLMKRVRESTGRTIPERALEAA